MPQVPVDVVVVHHGDCRPLRAALEALPPVASITVVDNGGDDPATVTEALEAEVTIIRPGRNLGFAAGFNRGAAAGDPWFAQPPQASGWANQGSVAAGTAPAVLSLNADAIVDPGCVEALSSALEGDARLAAVGPVLRLPSGAVDSTGIEVTTAGWAHERHRGASTVPGALSEPFGVSGAVALFRRDALREVGPLWEELFVYWEDVEWAWRARRRGWTFSVVAGAGAVHARGADRADPAFVEEHSLRGRLATLSRHTTLLRPSALVTTLIVIVRLTIRHPGTLRAVMPAISAGRRARAADCALALPVVPLPLAPHPWSGWLTAQITGARHGHGSLPPDDAAHGRHDPVPRK